jgi:hypothetical protein
MIRVFSILFSMETQGALAMYETPAWKQELKERLQQYHKQQEVKDNAKLALERNKSKKKGAAK